MNSLLNWCLHAYQILAHKPINTWMIKNFDATTSNANQTIFDHYIVKKNRPFKNESQIIDIQCSMYVRW